MLGNIAISWERSIRNCVTTASCEAEYVARCHASKEALFIRVNLVFLLPELTGMQVDIFCENEDAKAIADKSSSASRCKHINVELHSIQGLM